MLFYRARYYQPSVGRFTQEDPVGIQDDSNTLLYTYVENHPVTLIDPSGLSSCPPNVVRYIKELCATAKAVGATDCPARIMLIQSGLEAGWKGNNPDNNFFGLHGKGDRGWRPAKMAPKVPVAQFSSPQASFKEYCDRVKAKGIHYLNDRQFFGEVVRKLVFALGDDPSPSAQEKSQREYEERMFRMMSKCSGELDSCCGSR
jgi:hypothetical protein